MSFAEKIDKNNIPKHIAIIMDGNGRWAKARNKMRLFGHKQGVEAVRNVVSTSSNIGVKFLTVYAFSTENWNRPKLEIEGLIQLMVTYIDSELDKMHKKNVKINVIGDYTKFPKRACNKIDNALEITKNNTGLQFNIALNYSGRWDIINATKKIATLIKSGELSPEDIDENSFAQYLSTANMPDPDLMIRTSGELRISNYMLFQLAYSELYFTDTMWPDFDEKELLKSIFYYQNRERRFGMISEQINY